MKIIFQKIKKFTVSPQLSQIVGNTGWLFSEKILQMVLGLLVGVWVARYLGPTEFGFLNYALIFTSLFSPLAKLGLDRIVVRDIVQNPSDKNKILGSCFLVKFIGGIVAYLLTFVVISKLHPNDIISRNLVMIIGFGLCFQVFYTIDFWFQSQVKSKYTVWSKNLAYVLVNLIKIVLIYVKAPLVYFAWNVLIEVILSAIGLVIAYRLTGEKIQSWKINLSQCKKMLKDSLPLMFSGMVVMIYLRVDIIMLEQIFGSESVGIYSVATRISELWYVVPTAIVSSVSPSIIEAKSLGNTLYEYRLKKLFTLITCLAYAIAIPMSFLATPIVKLMYGEAYIVSGSVLSIHIWASVFVFLGLGKGIWIVAEGLTNFSIISTTCGAVVNVMLNLVLIPQYKEVGAAIATVISYGCADYLVYIVYPRFKQIGRLMTEALILKSLWRNN
jgi:PST family polysaccharide transporter